MSDEPQKLRTFVTPLLPSTRTVRLTGITIEREYVRLQLRTTAPAACCPRYAVPSSSVHSRYRRCLTDLPWGARPVRLQLTVWKFACRNPHCTRRIFTERVPELVASYARKTRRLITALQAIGLALGGQAGARLAYGLGLPASRDTLLRLVRRLPMPNMPTLSVIGVDDWAYRKRQRYGTIVVDLERRRPVALFHDREADTLASWLREHPEVTVIARDRLKAYMDGARAGAPQATQVADRFHLLQNLAEALDQVFSVHGNALNTVRAALSRAHPPCSPMAGTLSPCHRACRCCRPRRRRRSAGRDGAPPMSRSGRCTARVGPLAPSLSNWAWGARRWCGISRRRPSPSAKGGVIQARASWLPIKHTSSSGGTPGAGRLSNPFGRSSATAIRGATPRWHGMRSGCGKPKVSGHASSARGRRSRWSQRCSTRRATRVVLKPPKQWTDADTQLLAHLRATHSVVALAIALAQDFAAIVRARQPDRFDSWLDRATASGVSPLRRFATGLCADYEAVKAGLTLSWSTGPVEGQINRLKMLKRSMFGLAKLDLLSRRFLLAA